MQIKWRIYYADGTIFDSNQGEPCEAPKIGVIVIKQISGEHGWKLTAYKDFYIYTEHGWWGSDDVGFWQYMFTPGNKVVIFGTNTNDEEFNAIMKRAGEDSDFGEKTAKHPLEK